MSEFGVYLLLFVGVLLLVGVLRFLAWLTELQQEHGSLGRAGVNTVKRYVQPTPRVMSRSPESPPVFLPSALETDSRQTADKPALAMPSRDVMLNTFKLLRKYNIPREEARIVVKSLGLPLDNNLWTEAAPPDPSYVTPIVGRQTAAQFDPDYPYRPLEA